MRIQLISLSQWILNEHENMPKKGFSRIGLSLDLDGRRDNEIKFVGHDESLNYGIAISDDV